MPSCGECVNEHNTGGGGNCHACASRTNSKKSWKQSRYFTLKCGVHFVPTGRMPSCVIYSFALFSCCLGWSGKDSLQTESLTACDKEDCMRPLTRNSAACKHIQHTPITRIFISPTHKRTEGRAPVWGSEFTSKRRRTTGRDPAETAVG